MSKKQERGEERMEIHVLRLKSENWLPSKRKKRTRGVDMDLQGKGRKGEEHQSITKIKKLLAVR